MAILVFEPDIIVQSDIAETLAAAFADRSVELCETLGELLARLAVSVGEVVSIIPGEDREAIARIGRLIDAGGRFRFVLLGEPDTSLEAPAFPFVQVPLPFNTSMLIAAVRNAIAGLQ